MGAREHEGGVEAVQELHVVSSVLGHPPPLWVFGERPAAALLPPRAAAPVWGGSRQELRPRSSIRPCRPALDARRSRFEGS
jgi:hypothetical protein